ncbi:UBX domain-containing protein 10 [Sphaeramia orbicularis]|uniref:UBX domain-containing protein 10 n=1 Tax=Sphaeramia orbicularis TaxID=375764 RepID=UPI00117EA3EF|nr:UBX domain-containing protein 10 [Sphaeramia orbicularis]
MHLTRPKSSKGRSRPTVEDTDTIPRPPSTPKSPVYGGVDRNLRSHSQPVLCQTGLSQDEVLQMLQHVPAAPPQSFNKYKVLPSIQRSQSELGAGINLDNRMSHLNLSEPDLPKGRTVRNINMVSVGPPDPGPATIKDPRGTGALLLAIREPWGQRFEQHFDPSDTLLQVKASAEAKYGAEYGEASIETMDVPRRTFTDMNMTLAQCGILNKSVLCIFQNENIVDKE